MSPAKSPSDDAMATGLPEPVEAIRQLIRDRKVTKELFETEAFGKIWEQVPSCLNSDHAAVVWTTLAVLGRFAAVSKPAEKLAQPLIARRLSSELPDWIRLADGEDRYYLAKSMEYGSHTYISALAFRELAEEETAETARRIWATIASQSVASQSDFLDRLNRELASVRTAQNLNPDSVCRRLRRLNAVVDDFLSVADCVAGEDFGQHVRQLYCGHLPRSGPEDRDLREDAAGEFLASLKKIVRLNFSARMDPDTYKAVAGIRQWWGVASPSDSFEHGARQIARLGAESLLSFAKQGVKNKPLRQALVEASSEQSFEVMARDFAAASHSIEPEVAYWFVQGSEPKEERKIRGVAAISEEKLDEYVARLLIALETLGHRRARVEQALRDVTDILPAEGEVIEATIQRIAQIDQWARAVARSRQVELGPERSAVVTFDPLSHIGPEHLTVGAAARVSTPGAIKIAAGNVKVTILKAEVEQIRG